MKRETTTATENKVMEERKVKRFLKNMKKKVIPALSGSVMAVSLMSTQCFAAGSTTAITQPLRREVGSVSFRFICSM